MSILTLFEINHSTNDYERLCPPPPQKKTDIVDALRMISSPYCAVSEPNVYKHYKWLTRWNANWCYLFRSTYLIFETFQILYPTASLIFTAVKVFIKWYYQTEWSKKLCIDNGSWRETLNFLHDAKCYILWRLTWNKTKVANKLESAQYGLEISFKQQLLTNILPITVSFVVNNWVWQSRSTCFQNPCAWRWSGLTTLHTCTLHSLCYMH